MGLYDDDDYMLGALSLDESQFAMGAPRRARRPANRANRMLLPMTFPNFTFALANGTNNITNTMQPQVPFAGLQPIATILRNGASASLTFPLLNQLFVGPTPIIQTTPGPALDGYSKDSVNNNLRLPPTGIGQLYQASVGLTAALLTTDTLLVILQINGQAHMNPGYVGYYR